MTRGGASYSRRRPWLLFAPFFVLAGFSQSVVLAAVATMTVLFIADIYEAPQDEARNSYRHDGIDCLSMHNSADSKNDALETLNCLVFETSDGFWVADASQLKNCVDAAELEQPTDDPCSWLAYGNWRCSFVLPGSDLSACLKHDVAYSSLQKIGGDGGFHELHEFWHPRNKHLADLTFEGDLKQTLANTPWVRSTPLAEITSSTLFWATTRANNKTWPVTQQDIADIEVTRRFRQCAMPSIEDLTISAHDRTIGAKWTYNAGCVDNTVDYYKICWNIGLPNYLYIVFPYALLDRCHYEDGEATNAKFEIPVFIPAWESVTLRSAEIRPNDITFGSVLGFETVLGIDFWISFLMVLTIRDRTSI